MLERCKKILTSVFNFLSKEEKDFFQVLNVRQYSGNRPNGLIISINLIRKTKRFGFESVETEVVEYDNVHRRTASNIFFTFCPYVWDKRFIANQDMGHDGWGYTINRDSTEHSFIKLSKYDIEQAVDDYWKQKGIVAEGEWN